MNPPPETVLLARIALLFLAPAFCALAVFTAAILIRRFMIIPKFKKEFLELHTRRVARVSLALAGEEHGESDDGSAPSLLADAYAFSGWIDLGKDGTVTVAGQSFRSDEVFQAIARDGNNIPRAKAASTGQGVLISSHGRIFRAKFTGTDWDVQLVEDDRP